MFFRSFSTGNPLRGCFSGREHSISRAEQVLLLRAGMQRGDLAK
jgi:hypothetical protein